MQWLYVQGKDQEYCYVLKQNSEKFFLKDLGVCFNTQSGQIEENDVNATILKDCDLMFQVEKGKHQRLSPSHWFDCIKLIPILWLLYFLLTCNVSYAKPVNFQEIQKNIQEKNYTSARKNILHYEMYVNTQNPQISRYKFEIHFYQCQDALRLRAWNSIVSACKGLFDQESHQRKYIHYFKQYQRAMQRLFLEAYLIEPYKPIAALMRYKVILKLYHLSRHPMHKKALKRLHAMQGKV